jgi:hypothetical protein
MVASAGDGTVDLGKRFFERTRYGGDVNGIAIGNPLTLSQIGFVSSHYALIVAIASISFGAGRRLTRACAYDSVWEEIAFSTAIGLGAIAYLVFALALLHLLYCGVVVLSLVGVATFAVPAFADVAKRFLQYRRNSSFWPMVFALSAALLLLFPVFRMPLYPPTLWDSLMYHLPIAKLDVQTHSLAYSPYIRYPAFPQLNEMLFALMLILKDDVSAQLIQFLMTLLVAVGLYAWGKRLFSVTAGIWAAAIWLSNPFVLVVSSSAYIDAGLTLFICLGAYGFSNWLQTRRTCWLVVSGALFALGAASKYLALPPLCAFCVVLLFLSLREKNFRPLLVFTATVVVIAVPWYVRNYYYTGNPVWPYFGSIFGYQPWSAEDLKGLVHEQYVNQSPPRSFLSFLLLPWNISFRLLELFHMDAPARMSPAYFLALPFLAAYAIFNKHARTMLIGVFVYTVFWFFTFQAIRFLFPAVAVLGLAAMAACAHLFARTPFVGPKCRIILTTLVTGLLLLPGWKYSVAVRREASLPISSEQRNAYLARKFPQYPAYRLLNEKYGANYVLYAPGDEEMTYFAEGAFRGDFFGPARCMPIIRALSQNGTALYEKLEETGASFLLLNERNFRPAVLYGLPSEADDRFFQSHFRLIWAAPYIQLFVISRQAVRHNSAPELVKNGSFEAVTATNPEFWEASGAPTVDSRGRQAHAGSVTVGLSVADALVQRVEAKALQTYRLSQWTFASKVSESTRLHINWIGDRGLLRADIEIVSAMPMWTRHQMFATAPPGTRWADIYVEVQNGDGLVWFDDVSLAPISYEDEPLLPVQRSPAS